MTQYEIKISQRDKEPSYSERIEGTTETYEEAKELMEIVLRAFPRTTVTISMKETNTNITAEAETNTEED